MGRSSSHHENCCTTVAFSTLQLPMEDRDSNLSTISQMASPHHRVQTRRLLAAAVAQYRRAARRKIYRINVTCQNLA
uniref:Uncharacterized protein n=1 Tax=Physcomitrium patens TaxID=3218 RepID=A0A2K1ISV9_PHYPA|nr:hypothetical protein PHYPA_026490 [Physcomitrium patens]